MIEYLCEIHSHLVHMRTFFFARENILLKQLSFLGFVISYVKENPYNCDTLAVSIDSLSYDVNF